MSDRGEWLDKADHYLREALELAREHDTIRAVMLLGPEGASVHEPPPDPQDFASRIEYREAIIAHQRRRTAADSAETREALQGLSLNVTGGSLTSAVAVEGTADQIRRALRLPGVQHASLDRQVGLLGGCR